MGSVFTVKKMIEKGHPELKDNAHYYMCCVYVPKDGRSRKVALDEAIKHFESYEKEVIGAQYNQTFVSL